MNDLISKLSSYHLFNYLVPGVIFGVLARRIVPYAVGPHDIVTWGFLAYFVGLAASRFGSLVLEPILKRSKFMTFWDYEEFSIYSGADPHLSVLYEVSNMYRTLASVFLLLLLLEVYAKVETRCPILKEWDPTILATLMLVIFLFSYRKQTAYMTKRIDVDKKNHAKAQATAVD